MSKKIKLQDLSISNFGQKPDVEGIKGGGWFCERKYRWTRMYYGSNLTWRRVPYLLCSNFE
jgi:hypothetical protein